MLRDVLKTTAINAPIMMSGAFVAANMGVPHISFLASIIGVVVCATVSGFIAGALDRTHCASAQ